MLRVLCWVRWTNITRALWAVFPTKWVFDICLRLWRLALGALRCGSGGLGVVVGCIMHSCALLVLGPRSDQDKRGGVIRGGGQLQSWLPCGRVVGRWTNGS